MTEEPEFESQQGQGIFLFPRASSLLLRPHPGSYSMGTGTSFAGVKWPGYKTDYLSPSNAETKNIWSYTSTHPHMPSWHGA
jgi:hypothetical protein